MQNKRQSIGLDKSFAGHQAKKFICPNCGRRTYVRYYNYEDREYLSEEFGRCDREEHCQYFVAPWEELKAQHMSNKKDWKPSGNYGNQPSASEKLEIVPKDILARTIASYDSNPFVQWLISLFGVDEAMELVFRYYIGTAKDKGTIFWQVDRFMRIRTAQRIFYNPDGKRNHALGATRLFTIDKYYKPCMFGEHLLFDSPDNALVCIVESEKSAIICSKYIIYLNGRPVIWMASSGSNGLTNDKIIALEGRDIVLVPDFSYSARATWGLLPMKKLTQWNQEKEKMETFAHPDGILVEDYESAAMRFTKIGCSVSFFDPYPEVNDGSDLADYLTQGPPPPPSYDEPDYNSLILPDPYDINAVHVPTVENKAEIWEGVPTLLRSRKRFLIEPKRANGRILVQDMDQQGHESIVEDFLNQENIAYLVDRMGIVGGYIEPI